MTESSDNIIPFRRPGRIARPLNEHSQTVRPGELDADQRPHADPHPIVRKPRVPAQDIELSKRLSATSFLSPEQFLSSTAASSDASRKTALRREANLLARVIANDHRVFVLAPHLPNNVEAFYRQCYRLKTALDVLAVEFGKAALYNLGSFGVTFSLGQPSEWHKTERAEEQLRLNEQFSEQDVLALVRPRLKPAHVYEHEIFDVRHRNR